MKFSILLFSCAALSLVARMDENEIPLFAHKYDDIYGLQLKCAGSPHFVDIDGDGDLDACIVLKRQVHIIENTGTASKPNFSKKLKQPFGLETKSLTPLFFVDIDGDGDLDAFGKSSKLFNPAVFMQENIGSATNPVFDEPIMKPFGFTAGTISSPTFADIDGDGDYDAFGVKDGGLDMGKIFMCENIGSKEEPEFAPPVYTPFGLNQLSTRPPTFVDLLDDGVLDIISSKRTLLGYGAIYFQKNTGTKEEPRFEVEDKKPFGLNMRSTTSPILADINNDGNFEVFISKIDRSAVSNNPNHAPPADYQVSNIIMLTQNPVLVKPK